MGANDRWAPHHLFGRLPTWCQWLVLFIGCTGIYVALAPISRQTVFPEAGASLVWLPTAFGAAAIARARGMYLIPVIAGLAFGEAFADLVLFSFPANAVVLFVAGNISEQILFGLVIKRLGVAVLERPRDLLILAITVLCVEAVGAAIGAMAVVLTFGDPYWIAYRAWYFGGVTAMLVFAPFFLTFAWPRVIRWKSTTEFVVLAAVTITLSYVVFTQPATLGGLSPWIVAVTPLLGWIAIRFGIAGAALVSPIVVLIAAISAARGLGPFQYGSGITDLFVTQAFLVLATLTMYVVAMVEESRKRALESEQQTTRVINALMAESPVLVAVKEIDRSTGEGRFVLASDRFATMLGREPRDVVGARDDDVLGEALVADRESDRETLATGHAYSLLQRTVLDGSERELQTVKFPIGDLQQDIVTIGSVSIDVTEARRQAEQMRHIVDQSPVPIARLAWVEPERGRILDGNASFYRVLGRDAAVVGEHRLSDFETERSGSQVELATAIDRLSESGSLRVELALRRPDGAALWLLTTLSLIRLGSDESEWFVLLIAEDVTARHHAENRLQFIAEHDPLTRLPNRVALLDHLDRELDVAASDHVVAVLFCDLDGFKDINDLLGHAAGDVVLKEVADRLRESSRGGDVVARIGGDEFVVAMSGRLTHEKTDRIAMRIHEAVSRPIAMGDDDHPLSMSIGVAVERAGQGVTGLELLRRADTAMYHAKEQGRSRVEDYDAELAEARRSQITMRNELRHAIEEGRIELWYQPVIEASTGRVAGAEALVRLRSLDGTVVFPDQFIEIAETSGLINPLGEIVFDTALGWLTHQHQHGREVDVAINVSVRQLTEPGFANGATFQVRTAGIDPKHVVLEVTERVALDPTGRALATLHELAAAGFPIALDDFGTGYSSLTALREMPVTIVKIDRQFVAGFETDRQDLSIVRAVLHVSQDLGHRVVAEGVETATQAGRLTAFNCDYLQGYHFSKPVPADQFDDVAAGLMR